MVGIDEVGRFTAITLISGVFLASFAVNTRAFAQAGSTGGTLGKTDKSISGESQRETAPAPSQGKHARSPAFSLAGRWRWSADCNDGTHWAAVFVASANDSRTFALDFNGALGGSGTGSVNSKQVTLFRTVVGVHQTWLATLAGNNRMSGTITVPGGGFCTFQASR